GHDDGALALGKLPERDEQIRALDREVDLVADARQQLYGDVRGPAAPVAEEHPGRDDQKPSPRTIEPRESLLVGAPEGLLDRVLRGALVAGDRDERTQHSGVLLFVEAFPGGGVEAHGLPFNEPPGAGFL